MIQYADAALSGENKILSSPASIDNTSVSANQEDHVSMGLTASKKAYQLVKNVSQMIGIEIYTACQGLEFVENRTLSNILSNIYSFIREKIPPLKDDKLFDEEVYWVIDQIENRSFIKIAEKNIGEIFGDVL